MNRVITWVVKTAAVFSLLPLPALAAAPDPSLSWKDPVTGHIWHFLSQSLTWNAAVAGCRDMNTAVAGETGSARLPTLDEWWDAYDRIKDTSLARSLQVLQLKAWSADPLAGTDPLRIWALFLQSGNGGGIPATDLASAACLSIAGSVE